MKPESDVEIIFYAMVTRGRSSSVGKQIQEWTDLPVDRIIPAIYNNPGLFNVKKMDSEDPLGFSVGLISGPMSDQLGRKLKIDYKSSG
jgi:hypothetical protein